MDELEKLAVENWEVCRDLDGPDRCEFIENHLEDYHFALAVVSSPKILRYYRELLTKLVRDFGH
jgi:hypothetical protein